MELGLSLGDRAISKPSFGFMEKARDVTLNNKGSLGFCMALSVGSPSPNNKRKQEEDEQEDDDDEDEEEDYDTEDDQDKEKHIMNNKRIKNTLVDDLHKGRIDSALVQLDLLPNTPVPRQNRHTLLSPFSHNGSYMGKGLDVNRVPVGDAEAEAVSCSPPNSGASSFQMDFCKNANHEVERASSRASDEDENGCTRKKLRLSKQQSAFLEESFKEHTTLNPKQKLALAKHLNLRPRQVEVWFQNRRARTKLKQTEVDCEYLKRCCETLTEENRRLHKEVQELRTLKSSNPFYMQLPATTLTMCPSCERVATTSTPVTTTAVTTTTTSTQPTDLSLGSRPRFHPFNQPTAT
ncbi:Homeobox-leucine zipper protein family [Euphorbia peplus]|nr:Homeobox-leucine zipper protein family [Euphorbia peplus]